MKKIIVYTILLLCLLTLRSNAQSIGIQAGFNLATMLAKDNDGPLGETFKPKPVFHLGATMNIPFSEIFSLESSFLLNVKGFIAEEELLGAHIKANTILYYLDIPVSVKATHQFENGIKLFLATGPYAGIGLYGKTVGEITFQGETEKREEEIEWGSDEETDRLRRFDYGLSFGGGIGINAFQLAAYYQLGLANTSSSRENGRTLKNRLLMLSLTYFFSLQNT